MSAAPTQRSPPRGERPPVHTPPVHTNEQPHSIENPVNKGFAGFSIEGGCPRPRTNTPEASTPHGDDPCSPTTCPTKPTSPKKRLKAPAADDPHRIISNQDLNSHKISAGGDLLSHTLPGAVPSAQAGLASGFGKGPGVTPPLKPPTNLNRTNHTHPTTEDPPKKAKALQTVGVLCRSRHCTMNANT